MEITIDRYISNADTTLDRVIVDGKQICYALEDAYRDSKIKGKTRIPAGRYQVLPRYEGRHYARYRKIWPWHRGSLHVTNVPDFEWIMIHIGNTDEDTEGCLLLGTQTQIANNKMIVTGSRQAYEKFYKLIIGAAEEEKLWITYIDNDRAREAMKI